MATTSQDVVAADRGEPRVPAFDLAAVAQARPPAAAASGAPVLRAENFTVRYGQFEAVRSVTLDIPPNQVTAIIGPSGCGKSTLLRAMNRMNDLIDGVSVGGQLCYHGKDVYSPAWDPVDLRRRIGMVFQRPNPFPKSIAKNVSWGPQVNGYRGDIEELVEHSLRAAALWDEVKDKLHQSALSLSGGQQQRLCIARAIAMQPEVVLMDEPCSALDPIATHHIEELIDQLKTRYTVVLVTHNMQQAARVSDLTAFMLLGELVEVTPTNVIFTNPREKRTQDYITGRFG